MESPPPLVDGSQCQESQPADFFNQRGPQGKDRFIAGAWEIGPMGQPILTSAVASFECKVEASYTDGTHTVFKGVARSMPGTISGAALLYHEGDYCKATPLSASAV